MKKLAEVELFHDEKGDVFVYAVTADGNYFRIREEVFRKVWVKYINKKVMGVIPPEPNFPMNELDHMMNELEKENLERD